MMTGSPTMTADRLNEVCCAACGVSIVSEARFCQACGCPVGSGTETGAGRTGSTLSFEGRSSGTCCRGCGLALEPTVGVCPGCGRQAGSKRSSIRGRRISGGGETLQAIAPTSPIVEELDAILADRASGFLLVVERSSTELADRCRVAAQAADEPLYEIASHPSRARIGWWPIRELLCEIVEASGDDAIKVLAGDVRARLDEASPNPDAVTEGLAEVFVTAVPSGRATVLLDRAHRACGQSITTLGELAKLGIIRVVLRSPVDLAFSGSVTTLTDPRTAPSLPSSVAGSDDPGARVPPAEREVLRAAATLGWRAPLAGVEAIVERPIVAEIDSLEARGILARDGAEVVFTDPDFADAVDRATPHEIRSHLHDGALGWYASEGALLELRAEHAAFAPDLSTAVLLLDMLGRASLARGDTTSALEALTRGLERIRAAVLEGEDAATSRAGARLARAAAEVLLRQGDSRTAEGLLREALDRPTLGMGERAELTVMVGALAVGRGRHEDAHRQLERASEWARQGERPRVTADAELWLAQLEHSRGGDANAVAARVRNAWKALGDDKVSSKTAALAERVMKLLARAGHSTHAVALLDELFASPAAPSNGALARLQKLRAGLAAAS